MYGRVLKQIREAQGRSQSEVARSAGISPAQLARLESHQRGLYLEDFIRIAEVLGEKPGNLLPNDLGDIAHLKPLINRLLTVDPSVMPRVAAIVANLVHLASELPAARGKPKAAAKKAPRKAARKGKASRRAKRRR